MAWVTGHNLVLLTPTNKKVYAIDKSVYTQNWVEKPVDLQKKMRGVHMALKSS